MNWEIVIGLETHAQLSTASKMFSGASTAFGAAPNTQASAVDIALPGVLPVANKGAVELAVRFGLLVGGPNAINRRSVFARKNYFYPDLPKGYQISQYELPIVRSGEISIESPTRGQIKVHLTRAHLEEDAGKSIHGEEFSGFIGRSVPLVTGADYSAFSGIDLNRAGVPLLEIVSEPDMRSAEEAVLYAKALHGLVTWNEICDGNMQEGSFRCDANVSVRRPGAPLGTRAEIKNLNSFRFLERAIEFEAKRQIEILEDGGKIVQETRLYDSDKDETRSLRIKEEAHDYRYFPDPDLPPLEVSEADLERARIRIEQTEQPQTKRGRYVQDLALSMYDAKLLTKDRYVADYFEEILDDPELATFDRRLVAKRAVDFINGELAAQLNEKNISIKESPVKPKALAGHIKPVLSGDISVSTAKRQFPALWEKSLERIGDVFKDIPQHPKMPEEIRKLVFENPDTKVGEWSHSSTAAFTIADLWPHLDTSELEQICDDVLAKNAKQVEDYRAGKEQAFNSLVGQVMKATKGKANPAQVNEILKRKLTG